MSDVVPVAAPAVHTDRFKRALWAVVRMDSTAREQKFALYYDHSQKRDFFDPPIPMLLLWRTMDGAERYIDEELKGTGDLYPITQEMVVSELRGFLSTGIDWVVIDKPPINATAGEHHRTGWVRTRDLIRFLTTGGRIRRG